jgi:hypothetical protein
VTGAVVLRLAGLGDRLSADEGYSWLVGSAGSWSAFLDRLAAYENAPPLFYALLTPLPLGDEAWIRLPALAAGVAAVPLLYAVVKPLGGARAGLLAALAMAVAPYAVSFSNYARGFTLADAGLLIALAAVVRLALGGTRRWWWAYASGAVIALYAQYDSALFLAALIGALLWTRVRPLREVVMWGALPALALLPWLPELLRGIDAIDETKVSPVYPGLSLRSLDDVVGALAFGEHGARAGLGIVALLLVGGALWALRGSVGARLLGGAAAGTLLAHAILAAFGPDVFQQRYLTELIPLGAAIVALAVVRLPRPAYPGAVVLLVAAGAAVFVQRHGRELEPDVAAVAPLVQDRDVVTNSAVVAYYLRDLHPVLDRPFGLGRGLDGPSLAVVDDTRVAGGARPGPGPVRRFGPIAVRLPSQVPGG